MNEKKIYNARTIPYVTDATERGDRMYDVFSRLLKDRIIFLYAPIDEYSAANVCAQLLVLQAESSTKPVQLYISSPGGSVYDCISIIDTMACMPYEIHTYALGLVASAGAVIFAMGTIGYRYALKNTRLMIHQPSGGSRGQATDIEIQTREILFLKSRLTEIMAQCCGKPTEQLRHAMERDNFLSAEDAKLLGFVDHILEHKPKILQTL